MDRNLPCLGAEHLSFDSHDIADIELLEILIGLFSHAVPGHGAAKEQDVKQLLKVRREKLADLQERGMDRFVGNLAAQAVCLGRAHNLEFLFLLEFHIQNLYLAAHV